MWVARNKGKNGELCLSFEYPPERIKELGVLADHSGNGRYIDPNLFPDLKWKDDPLEVELVPKRHTNQFEDNFNFD